MQEVRLMADSHNGNGAAIVDINIADLIIDYELRADLGDLNSMQGSIRRDGVLVPLTVCEDGKGKYIIIDGRRRCHAAKEMGLKTLPCIVGKNIPKYSSDHRAYVINKERNLLNPLEEAMHLKSMQINHGFSYRDLEIMGYGSPSTIANRVKLLDLAEKVKKQLQIGEITQAHALELIRLPSEGEQVRFAKRIIDHDMTVKRAARHISQYVSKGKGKAQKQKSGEVVPSGVEGVYIKDSRDMSELPDKSVHLIVSSPPYFVGKEYEVGMSFEEHCEMVQDVLKECARVLKPGCIMALNIGDIYNFKHDRVKDAPAQIELMGHRYKAWLKKFSIILTDIIIWNKGITPWRKRLDFAYTSETVHTSYRIYCKSEPIYIFRKKGEREVPSEDIALRSLLTKQQWIEWVPGVWNIKPVQFQEGHPTIYPDELCYRLIKMFSYEGDTVLDPMLGSGTTMAVARELNRVAIGYEREPQYVDTILRKLGAIPEEQETRETDTIIRNMEKMRDDLAVDVESEVVMSIEDDVDPEQRIQAADDYLEMGMVDQL